MGGFPLLIGLVPGIPTVDTAIRQGVRLIFNGERITFL